MKKLLNVLAIVIPVLAAVVFIILFITSSSNLGSTRQSLAALQTTSTSAISSKDQEIASRSTEAAATLAKGVGDLRATNALIETQKKNLLGTYTGVQIELDNLEKSISCRTQLTDVDFSNNATVSKALITWVGDLDGSNLNATWEVIWSNSRTAIHKLRGKYLWVFLVYFDDEDMGYKNTIYSVDGMCYVYRSPV